MFLRPDLPTAIVTYQLDKTITLADVFNVPGHPSITPSDVGNAVTGTFSFDTEQTQAAVAFGDLRMEVEDDVFDQTPAGGDWLNTTHSEFRDDVGVLGDTDELFVIFSGAPGVIGGSGQGATSLFLTFVDQDGTALDPPIANLPLESFFSPTVADYEEIRWTMQIQDITGNGQFNFAASGLVTAIQVPEPSAGLLGLLATSLLLRRARRSS